MLAGTRIDYRLRLRGIPLRWQSEITEWNPPHAFVDVQRRGPYRLWRHTHTFDETEGGVVVGDSVEYAVWGNQLIEKFFCASRYKENLRLPLGAAGWNLP